MTADMKLPLLVLEGVHLGSTPENERLAICVLEHLICLIVVPFFLDMHQIVCRHLQEE